MSGQSGIPKGASIAISDLLDSCVKVQSGQEVLLLAHCDGLYGGDNLVDHEAINWIQSAIQNRGANASVLWIDEPAKPHQWRFPPVVKAAVSASDIVISHSFDLTLEEISEFKHFIWENQIRTIRNFATTAALLNTAWAQTPYELVGEIRQQISRCMKEGLDWELTHENGTRLSGKIVARRIVHPWQDPGYTGKRPQKGYVPWPEWMHRPVRLGDTTGVFIFDRMLSWWSRYIGISPYFDKPIRLTIDKGKIIKIEGGYEADALSRFLKAMKEHFGDAIYDAKALHSGVHPHAMVASHQCPNILHQRLIEHSNCANIHIHIGAPPASSSYPYWMHCTGDILGATFKVGDKLVHDRGYLTVLDSPEVRAIAAKYPGRPGTANGPRSY